MRMVARLPSKILGSAREELITNEQQQNAPSVNTLLI